MTPTTHTPVRRMAVWGALLLGASVSLGGCAIEWQNKQAAQQLAEQSRLPGSNYTGWRVFQDKCASCHGADATGGAQGPNLTQRMRDMGPNQFVSLVLKRYEWGYPSSRIDGQTATMDKLVDAIVQRQEGQLNMPAWQSEPRVNAHIMDLYAYLSARAEGREGAGRPAP
ncbi:MAG: c-type cytochrome [Aquabacterium sp.]